MMTGHTPTMFASIALVASIMAFCLMLVRYHKQGRGMLTTGFGLLCHALAYGGFALYGQVPLWLSYSSANTLLALAVAFYTLSVPRIQGRRVALWPIFGWPLLMVLLQATLLHTREPRMLAACGVLIAQCVVLVHHARQQVLPGGRAHLLLIVSSVISAGSLLLRVVVIAMGRATEMQYNASNFPQTVSVAIGTLTVMMMSLGLVLLSKERSEAALEHLALRDELTGVFNRRAILEQLEAALERARRSASPMALALLDIDHFKRINDQHGHLAGDEVLRHFVRQIGARLRRSDSLGRYGGEEFLLLLPDTDTAGAIEALEALRSAIAATPAQAGQAVVPVRFSAGVWCGIPGPGDQADPLIDAADTALYAAKAAGRDTVRLARTGAA